MSALAGRLPEEEADLRHFDAVACVGQGVFSRADIPAGKRREQRKTLGGVNAAAVRERAAPHHPLAVEVAHDQLGDRAEPLEDTLAGGRAGLEPGSGVRVQRRVQGVHPGQAQEINLCGLEAVSELDPRVAVVRWFDGKYQIVDTLTVNAVNTVQGSLVDDAGDMDGDRHLTPLDLTLLELAVYQPATYAQFFADLPGRVVGDIDGNGLLTRADVRLWSLLPPH